ncbi:MAG: hypothetical protein R3C41_21065 [Calditrichia bacterium]
MKAKAVPRKEGVLARMIHRHSARTQTAGNGKLRCAAGKSARRSELFGHVKARIYRRDKRSFGQI